MVVSTNVVLSGISFHFLTVFSPRFNIKLANIEKAVNNLLPSRQFGFIVLTTSSGIMTHVDARKRGVGGKVLGYFY